MPFSDMFKRSASELKNIRCIVMTGVLIACYVILNSPMFSYNTEVLKITFGYLALASIGMLFGPVVAVIAAIPCDIIAAMMGSLGINPIFTIPKIIEGFIYGIFLYGYANRGIKNDKGGVPWASWQVMRIVVSRVLVMTVVYFLLNSYLTLAIYSPPSAEGKSFWAWAWTRSGIKNLVQLPIDLALMFIVLPTISLVHNKARIRTSSGGRVLK